MVSPLRGMSQRGVRRKERLEAGGAKAAWTVGIRRPTYHPPLVVVVVVVVLETAVVRLLRPALASVVRMADIMVVRAMMVLRVIEKRLDCGILHGPQPDNQVSANAPLSLSCFQVEGRACLSLACETRTRAVVLIMLVELQNGSDPQHKNGKQKLIFHETRVKA